MLAKRHPNTGASLLGNVMKLKILLHFTIVCMQTYTNCCALTMIITEIRRELILYFHFIFSTTFLLTLFSQVMVDVKFPFIVYRKNQGLQIRWFNLFKLFPVGD